MGKMSRCPEGHFFDVEKHSSCPWCSGQQESSGNKTQRLTPPPTPPPVPDPARRDGRTRRLDETDAGVRPVVGWLVCVQGPEKGKDYRLHAEKNFIGRAASMDVCIAADSSVSREKHAIVTYEPKKRQFFLQPGESEGLVYLNDEVVHTPTRIEPYQVIEVGNSKLVMVPFDSTQFES